MNKMANALIVVALCIPFFSCGKAPEAHNKSLKTPPAVVMAQPMEIEPDMRVDEIPQQQMMRQESIHNRVEKRLGNYCEDKLVEVERELDGASGKYRSYLRIQKKALLERCIDKYK